MDSVQQHCASTVTGIQSSTSCTDYKKHLFGVLQKIDSFLEWSPPSSPDQSRTTWRRQQQQVPTFPPESQCTCQWVPENRLLNPDVALPVRVPPRLHYGHLQRPDVALHERATSLFHRGLSKRPDVALHERAALLFRRGLSKRPDVSAHAFSVETTLTLTAAVPAVRRFLWKYQRCYAQRR
jgi:hypothetical protein